MPIPQRFSFPPSPNPSPHQQYCNLGKKILVLNSFSVPFKPRSNSLGIFTAEKSKSKSFNGLLEHIDCFLPLPAKYSYCLIQMKTEAEG